MKKRTIPILVFVFAYLAFASFPFHPFLNEGCDTYQGCFKHANQELNERFENTTTTETIPDCREHEWYQCPYPLHIVGLIILVLLISGIVCRIQMIIGLELKQSEQEDRKE